MMPRVLFLLFLVCLVSLPARADEPAQSGNPATAVAALQLSQDAKALADAGKWSEACPKYEESYRLQPLLQTLYFLADCEENQKKLASAWAHFSKVAVDATLANLTQHAQQARSRAEALKGRLSRLIVTVSDTKVPGLDVRRDGLAVPPAQFGVAIPVDAGRHEITVSGTGRRSWTSHVEVSGEGGTFTVVVPPLPEDPVPVVGSSASASSSVPVTSGNVRATAGVVVGGIGLLTLGVGATLGFVGKATYDEGAPYCNAQNACTLPGYELRRKALTIDDAATGTLIAGAALLAGGVTLWLTAPSKAADTKSASAVVVGPGSFSIVGRF